MHQPTPSRPPDTATSLDLALSHHRAGRLVEAEAIYRRILKQHPAHARAAHLLGLAAHQDGRLSEALALIRHSIALDPAPADFHSNLGTVLAALGQKTEAEAAFRQALSINADYPDAAINLANVLREQHRLDEAAEVGTEAQRRWPRNADVHNALGTILERQQRVREALACFSQAVSLRPDYPQAKMNRAMALLALGDFEHGWREYEARLSLPGPTQQRRWPTPRWDGGNPAGRTILLHTEGGLGNVMQFARFAQRLAGRGAKVILEAPPPLQQILRSLKGVQVMAMGQKLPPHEVQAPLCSLPMLLGATAADLAAEVPYLQPEPALAEHFKRTIAAEPELAKSFRVGITWQGNPKFHNDAVRSIPLKAFAPLARIPGVTLISLQRGPGSEQIESAGFPIRDLGGPPKPADGAFINTAAMMTQLDLVITSDTSIAHLAGALARPVWVALSFNCCWRWMLDRDDTPWYPTMRLFRQERLVDWQQVFHRIAEELKALAGVAPQVPISPGELLDKISILQIKAERFTDPAKMASVRAELSELESARDRTIRPAAELTQLCADLRAVNQQRWDIEDALRQCEQKRDFGEQFVSLARSVYKHNDNRADLKRRINSLLASRLREEKGYEGQAAMKQ